MNKPMLDSVFTLARLGLAAVAGDPKNGAGIIAQHAVNLEQWRLAMEKQLAEPVPTDAKP